MTPGQPVDYLETTDGTWHPGTVKFDFCELSEEGPYTLVIDEDGWGHTCHADWMRDRIGLWNEFLERIPGRRKQ